MATLDRGEQGERTWVVQTQRRVETEGRAMGYQLEAHTGEAFVHVTAQTMEITHGALVFRDTGGELSWVFGPGGWFEVVRA